MKNKSVAGGAVYEMRYEERNGNYRLDSWPIADITETVKAHGPIADRPEWLVTIINIAKIGGKLSLVPYPPPDAIVWFTVDAQLSLLDFIDYSPVETK
jgi:hypothetical protein